MDQRFFNSKLEISCLGYQAEQWFYWFDTHIQGCGLCEVLIRGQPRTILYLGVINCARWIHYMFDWGKSLWWSGVRISEVSFQRIHKISCDCTLYHISARCCIDAIGLAMKIWLFTESVPPDDKHEIFSIVKLKVCFLLSSFSK